MAKKNKAKKKKHPPIDDFFDQPVVSPFEDCPDPTFDTCLLGDLFDAGDSDADLTLTATH